MKHLLLSFFFLRQKVLSPLLGIDFFCFSVSTCSLPGDVSQPAMKSVPPRKTQCKLITTYIIPDIMISTFEVETRIQVHSIV